ncbi:MAG TPA: hypothetical protein VI078_12045 [bacterium]
MKKKLLLAIAAVALATAGPAQGAGLSLTGETGVARTPVAMTLPPLGLAVGGDLFASSDLFVPMRAEIGLIEGLEVGANYWYEDTTGSPTLWGVNAKYQIPAGMDEALALAAGVNYQSYSADGGIDVGTTKVYGVLSYTWETRFTFTPSAGFSYEIQSGDRGDSGIRFFANFLAQITPKLALGAEFNSTNSDLDGEDADSDLWVGARFWPRENLAIQGGFINNADLSDGGFDSKFTVHAGAQYSFSLTK